MSNHKAWQKSTCILNPSFRLHTRGLCPKGYRERKLRSSGGLCVSTAIYKNMEITFSLILSVLGIVLVLFFPPVIATIRKNKNDLAIFVLSLLSLLPTAFCYLYLNNNRNVWGELAISIFTPVAIILFYIGWTVAMVWSLAKETEK